MRPAFALAVALMFTSPFVCAQPASAPPAKTDPGLNSAADALTLLRSRSFPTALAPKMLELLQAAAKAEPDKADWQIGIAYLGMSRLCDAIVARNAGRRAAELAPQSAEAWACRGSAVFMSIGQADFTEKMGLADEGKEAYLKAIALDQDNIEARIGLARFYMEAPGIAGGSYKKAREHAGALKQIKGWEFRGQLLLAEIEAEDDNYKKAAAAYEEALKLAKDDQDVLTVHFRHGDMLLSKKEDPKAAIAYLSSKIEPLKDNGINLRYLLGKAYQENEQWKEAQAEYEIVLKVTSEARNARYGLCEVLRKQKKYAEAAAAFRAFAKDFSTDKRAKKAIEEAEDCESRK